jgi:site-specific recombinase XerD
MAGQWNKDEKQSLPEPFSDYWRGKLETEIRSRKYSPNTRTAYIYHNKALCKWLMKTPETVTSEDIKYYLAYLEREKRQAASTLNFALSSFKFFYRHVMKRDTAHEQKRPRHDVRLPSVFAKSEIIKILGSIRNPKHRLMLMITYDSGLRVSELVNLKRENIDIVRKVIIIVSGKGRKDRRTIMSNKVIETLALYYSQYEITDWLFPGADPTQHISVRSAQKIFKHAQKKAKIEKNGSFHSLRHTFATHLLENGTGIIHIRDLLGHSSVRTTERYTQVANLKTLNITSPLDMIDREDEG